MPNGPSTIGRLSSLAALVLLAACAVVPPVPPSPPPAPAPTTLPPPPPPPIVAAPEKTWDVAALTPGDWAYRREGSDSLALFGAGNEAILVLRCEAQARRIRITLTGVRGDARAMTIRTSDGVLDWPAAHDVNGIAPLSATRPASDNGFNWIAYSRGRISVEVQGAGRLILPVWAEVSRVIEDCRG